MQTRIGSAPFGVDLVQASEEMVGIPLLKFELVTNSVTIVSRKDGGVVHLYRKELCALFMFTVKLACHVGSCLFQEVSGWGYITSKDGGVLRNTGVSFLLQKDGGKYLWPARSLLSASQGPGPAYRADKSEFLLIITGH